MWHLEDDWSFAQSADDQDYLELGQWIVGPSIGCGESGKVRVVRHRMREELGALKMVRKPSSTGTKAYRDVYREIEVLKIVQHRHIITLKDVMESKNHLYLVTDYCEFGSLFDWLRGGRTIDSPDVQRYFSQLVSALVHLKFLSIAHRDIKLENLFLYENEGGETSLKLGDLGLSTFFTSDSMLETSCGSPHYAAPEVISGTLYNGSAADVWSSGVVLFAMISRTLPFDNENVPALLSLIKIGRYDMHALIQGNARDLVTRMLNKDPTHRISIEEIQIHSFVVASGLLGDDPDAFDHARAELEDDLLERMASILGAATIEEVAQVVLSPNIPNDARYFYLSLLNEKHRAVREGGRGSLLAESLPSTTFSSLPRSPSAPGSLDDAGSRRCSYISPPARASLRRSVSMVDSFSASPPDSILRRDGSFEGSSACDGSASSNKENVSTPLPVRPVIKKRSASLSLFARRLSITFRGSIDGFPTTPSSHDRSSIGIADYPLSTPVRSWVFQRSLRYASLGRAVAGKSPLKSPTVHVTASPLLPSKEWQQALSVEPADGPVATSPVKPVARKRSWLLGGGARRFSAFFGSNEQDSASASAMDSAVNPPPSSGASSAKSGLSSAPPSSLSSGSQSAKRRPSPLLLAKSNKVNTQPRVPPSVLSPRDPRTNFTLASYVPPRSPLGVISSPRPGPHSAPPAFSPTIIGVPPTPTTAVPGASKFFFPTRSRADTFCGAQEAEWEAENRKLRLENALLKREIEFKDEELNRALQESKKLKVRVGGGGGGASNLVPRSRRATPLPR